MYQDTINNILCGFDNIKEHDIRESIKKKKTLSDCIYEIVHERDYSYYPVKLSMKANQDNFITIENAVILLGYYSEKPISFHVQFGNNYKEDINIPTYKTFIYAINNSFPFMFMKKPNSICKDFIISQLKDDIDIYLIYGVMAFNDRMFLLLQNNDLAFTFSIGNDTYLFHNNDIVTIVNDDITCVSMKKLYVYEHDIRYYMTKSKERQDIFFKELMEKTWHPSRFMKWCLGYNNTIC